MYNDNIINILLKVVPSGTSRKCVKLNFSTYLTGKCILENNSKYKQHSGVHEKNSNGSSNRRKELYIRGWII